MFSHEVLPYLDLDYVYGTLSNSDGENPLDLTAILRNPAQLLIVASNTLTGNAKYFDKTDQKPDDTCGVDTLTKDRAALERLYPKGYQDGQSILNFTCSEKADFIEG